MNLELKKIKENKKEIYYSFSDELSLMDKLTDKYIDNDKGGVIKVKVKGGILKFKKGDFHGVDGQQSLDDILFKPIKFVEYYYMNESYLKKVLHLIIKEFKKSGTYIEEGIFYTNYIGSIYLQDLEEGDKILGDMTKEELEAIYNK